MWRIFTPNLVNYSCTVLLITAINKGVLKEGKPVVVSLDAKRRGRLGFLPPPPPPPTLPYERQPTSLTHKCRNVFSKKLTYFELLGYKLQRCQEQKPRAYYTCTHWRSCSLSQFWLSVCQYIHIYQVVYTH